MIIMASDVGSRHWGVSILSITPDEKELIHCDSWYLKETRVCERMVFLEKEMSFLIEKYSVTNLGLEIPFLRGANTHDVYFCTGIMYLLAGKYSLPIIRVTASEAKLAVTGNGKADKKEMESGVRKYFNLPPEYIFKSDHSSDSVGIGITCFKALKLK
jgi:crossover junction endodeoxyribonuclease RuvC